MQERGFIRDMLDVKTLILFVMSECKCPADLQKIYELCYQDDRLSYFDVSVAVPQMVESGHLAPVGHGKYQITSKGREAEAVTADAIAFPVMQRAKAAVQRFNLDGQKEEKITSMIENENGELRVKIEINDEKGNLMRLDLLAANSEQAEKLQKAGQENAAEVYRCVMEALNRAKL